MLTEARRHKVLELIKEKGFVSLSELCQTLDSSESTLRRDLEYWDQQGIIKRTHGGAMFTGEQLTMPAFDDRVTTNLEAKRLIARTALHHIPDGSVILLDGGTTTYEIARLLVGRSLQVVTNSLPIASLLSARREIDLILLGGYIYPKTGVALGPLTIAQLERMHIQKAFIGVSGITPKGLFNSNLLLVETERAMMRSATEVIVVADHSKIDHTALAQLCKLNEVHTLIVDAKITSEQQKWISDAGVRLIQAPWQTGTEGGTA